MCGGGEWVSGECECVRVVNGCLVSEVLVIE